MTLVAALGGAAGVAYAAGWHARPADKPLQVQPPANVVAIGQPITTPPSEPQKPAAPPRDNVQDTVQIALVLDTSGSMDGLINQARSQLWNMVDQMGRMTRVVDGPNGKTTRGVRIELALFEYGNDTLSANTGYIRQVLPFTTDLDKVSEQLHGLFTNGGSEYVGQAITTAVSSLQWSSDPAAMRFVFVAGNEEFDQGPVSAAKAMTAAAGKDITVQLIHCGPQEATWAAAAKLAKSDLMTIDHNHVALHIPAPQDDEILRLGNQLNATYLAYGVDGFASLERQKNADLSSAQLSPKVALERAQLKSKHSYDNANWDIVDARNRDAKFFEQTPDAQLPAELRGKTAAEKEQIVAAKAAERAQIQGQIAKLEVERTKFLDEARRQQGQEANSLETELMKTTKSIAAKKGYQF